MNIALITGITGQDGSYLAELLLSKNYIVWGLLRRASTINTKRIDHLYNNPDLILKYSDMTDSSNLCHLLCDIKNNYPKLERLEIYNLAAMSHVKVSFELPEYTGNVDGIGVVRLLEAIRLSGISDKIRFYQASTSDLYGLVQEVPQKETTPFYPRWQYGVAKLYGFWITKNYRESYNLFCSNGILFNHETLAGFMPLIYKKNGVIDIKPISEIVKYETLNNGCLVDENNNFYQQGCVETELYVWDNNDWTKVKFASGYPHQVVKDNKKPKFLISKNAAYMVTGNHEIIMEDDSEKKCEDIKIDDMVKLVSYPTETGNCNNIFGKKTDNRFECLYCNKIMSRVSNLNIHMKKCESKRTFMQKPLTCDESELLGFMIGDGNMSKSQIRFTNKDIKKIHYIRDLWIKVCKYNDINYTYVIKTTKSGFKKVQIIYQIALQGFVDFFRKYQMYNEDKTKRIPYQLFNTSKDNQKHFLKGYNQADGLKKNKCIYEFKNIKTNSATLAQGLLYLLKTVTNQNFNINVEYYFKWGKERIYYS